MKSLGERINELCEENPSKTVCIDNMTCNNFYVIVHQAKDNPDILQMSYHIYGSEFNLKGSKNRLKEETLKSIDIFDLNIDHLMFHFSKPHYFKLESELVPNKNMRHYHIKGDFKENGTKAYALANEFFDSDLIKEIYDTLRLNDKEVLDSMISKSSQNANRLIRFIQAFQDYCQIDSKKVFQLPFKLDNPTHFTMHNTSKKNPGVFSIHYNDKTVSRENFKLDIITNPKDKKEQIGFIDFFNESYGRLVGSNVDLDKIKFYVAR